MLDHPCLRHLTSREWDVLSEFLSRLRGRCGDRIAHVWLFGSKARGDFNEESDVDLLIVTRDADAALDKAVSDIAYDLSLEHGVLLCEHVVSAWRFAQMRVRREFVYQNIAREGVDLWSLIAEFRKIAEEQASYSTVSPDSYGDHGTYEDYLRERRERF